MPANMMGADFQHILRMMNTNVDGKRTCWVALTAIKGIGRNFALLVCRKAGIDINKRAGELTPEEIEKVNAIIQGPVNFKIPSWYLNRRRDYKDGKDKHLISNQLDSTYREDMERYKKIRCNKGLRHYWGYRVRGQHTKTTGRYGLLLGDKTSGGKGKK